MLPRKPKPKSASKSRSGWRVYWFCPECGGEGGDYDDFTSRKKMRAWIKELKADGKTVDICRIRGEKNGETK